VAAARGVVSSDVYDERIAGSYRSGQTGQTVNLMAYAFAGSNPALPIFDCGFGIADCGFGKGEREGEQVEIRNPKSAIRNRMRV
jgi:hypothetical protein